MRYRVETTHEAVGHWANGGVTRIGEAVIGEVDTLEAAKSVVLTHQAEQAAKGLTVSRSAYGVWDSVDGCYAEPFRSQRMARGFHAMAAYSDGEDRAPLREAIRASMESSGWVMVSEDGAMADRGNFISMTQVAHIALSVDRSTIGVEVFDEPRVAGNPPASYSWHQYAGTYERLTRQEQHWLSGAGGTVEKWLAEFARCGKPVPACSDE